MGKVHLARLFVTTLGSTELKKFVPHVCVDPPSMKNGGLVITICERITLPLLESRDSDKDFD